MNPKNVEGLIARFRSTLAQERATQNQDLPVVEQDARLSEFLLRKAKAERDKFDSETRGDRKFAAKLEQQQTKAARLVGGEFRDELSLDRKIHDFESAIAMREELIRRYDRDVAQLSREILKLIDQQEQAIDEYLRVITDQTKRLNAVKRLLGFENRKQKLLDDKNDLLKETILQRSMVLHNRQLLKSLEDKKRQLIRNLERDLPKEEEVAGAEEVKEFEVAA